MRAIFLPRLTQHPMLQLDTSIELSPVLKKTLKPVSCGSKTTSKQNAEFDVSNCSMVWCDVTCMSVLYVGKLERDIPGIALCLR